jgi:hypothetical protein
MGSWKTRIFPNENGRNTSREIAQNVAAQHLMSTKIEKRLSSFYQNDKIILPTHKIFSINQSSRFFRFKSGKV